MTSPVPQTPEPTDEQRDVMQQALGFGDGPYEDLPDYARFDIDFASRALAAAVQQERDKVHAQYEKVAAWLDETANDDVATGRTIGDGYSDLAVARVDAARRIREVSQ